MAPPGPPPERGPPESAVTGPEAVIATAAVTPLFRDPSLRAEPVTEAELTRVRDFVKGRIELRLEHSRGVSSWLAGQELFLEKVRSVEELIAIIDGIGAADLQRVAQRYLRPELAYLAAVGPRAIVAELTAPGAPEEVKEQLNMEKAS